MKISLVSIDKSGRVLYAMTKFYLPVYGLDSKFLFFNADIFGAISAAVYHIDEIAEMGVSSIELALQLDKLERYIREKNLFDASTGFLLEDAREYYAFEQKTKRYEVYSLDELINITGKRSFDFKLMRNAMIRRAGLAADERLDNWFRLFEVMMEIEDDLSSLADDESRNTFNIFNLAKRIHSCEAPSFVESLLIGVYRSLEEVCLTLSEPYKSRCRDVVGAYREIVPVPQYPMSH